MISSQASGRSVIAARTCHISSPSRTVAARAGQRRQPGRPSRFWVPAVRPGQQRVPGHQVDRAARVRGRHRDGHVQRGQAGAQHHDRLAVGDAPQHAGCPRVGDVPGAVRHRARCGGRGAAHGQHRGVGVDVAVGREVQPQRVPRGAVADPDDMGGDRGDGGGRARPGAVTRRACRTGSARSRTCAGTRRARCGSPWPSAATGPGRRRPRSSCRRGSSAGDRDAWWSTPGRARACRRRRSARCAPAAARRRPGGADG